MKPWWVGAVAVSAVLWRLPPERYGFYPHCPVYEAFGLLCPGCGATRAASALLHGRISDAWHANALFVTVLAAAALYGLAARRGERLPRPPTWAMVCAATGVAFFTAARNL